MSPYPISTSIASTEIKFITFSGSFLSCCIISSSSVITSSTCFAASSLYKRYVNPPIAIPVAIGNAVNWFDTVSPKVSSLPERVTNIPDAVDINNAGT